MQLNKREKKLLIIAASLLFVFLLYNFILNPQINKLSKLKEQEAELLDDLSNSKTSINTIKSLDKEIEDKKKKISFLTSDLFPELEQSRIILLLDKFIEESNLKLDAINFSEKTMKAIQLEEIKIEEKEDSRFKNIVNQYNNLVENNKELVENETEQSGEKEEAKESTKLESISATIVYSGDYHEINNFLSLIDNYNKDIIIRGITMVKNEKCITGNILLDFYGIPKIDEFKDDFEIPNTNVNGKDNPFIT
ncbi:hypothetical protein [Senegalia massiliensis]|uniref:hypothetical protein n=1 Tax=Senegalia massiliensis TaxID=1720316 RepID=UPI0010305AB9|nr:hypothetical protein [Senegalia massiliensis]